jgi:RND family efflux transporter MFP subunit
VTQDKKPGVKEKTQNMGKSKRAIFLLLPFAFGLLPIALCLLLSGCKGKVGPATVSRQTVEGVTVTEVHPSEIEEYFETSGAIRAKTISRVAGQTMGTVTSLRVKEGDRVHAGQVLLTVDDRDAVQKVIAAEKALESSEQNRSLADITYRRYRKLFDEKALSQQEIDQIETQKKITELDYERSKALLNEARVNRDFTTIVSPVSGVVTEKKTERGSMAIPGMPLLTVEDVSSFILEAHLDEHLIGKVTAGTPVDISVDATNQHLRGTINEIVPSIDPLSRTFIAKIALTVPSLRTGLYARVRIPTGKKIAIVLPYKAIVEKGQLTGVYIVDQSGIITFRLVRPGSHYGNNVEILSGIKANDRVIIDNLARAVDGGIIAGMKIQ